MDGKNWYNYVCINFRENVLKNSYYYIYLNYVCIMFFEKNFFLCVLFEGINILWIVIYDIIKYFLNFIL